MRSVIVVFGASTRQDGRPSVNLERRLQRTLVEARDQPRVPVIVSGGAVTGPAEGPVMRRWLVAHGVDPARILVEPLAKYTLDNAAKVAPLILGLHATQVTLVTQAFHMTRSAALLAGVLGQLTRQNIAIREACAQDSAFGKHARDLRSGEAAKLARDLATLQHSSRRADGRPLQSTRATIAIAGSQPPKMVRAHACAGSIKTHKTSQYGA